MGADDNGGDERNMAPIDETNELIEHFKRQVDREALRENPRLTPAERMEKLQRLSREKLPSRAAPDLAPEIVPVIQEPAGAYAAADTEEELGADASNDLIEVFKKDVDRTLLVENLKLSVPQRMEQFERNMKMLYELRRGMRRAREAGKDRG
jgi:hypothetical protein